jgi:mono/diheme cytochrome c family protein
MIKQRIRTMIFLGALFGGAGNAQSGKIGRGKYLTEEVAKCQDCHTQRLASGKLDKKAWLKGATPSGKSRVVSPDITSGGDLWKQRGEMGMLRFLENGGHPEGTTAGAPMPPYKLRPDDAEAIVAYLKSLR